MIADHDATSAVERELVLRLASVLWRLRRATGIETALFESAIRQSLHFQSKVFGRVTADRLLAQVFLEGKDESKNSRDPPFDPEKTDNGELPALERNADLPN